MPKVGVAVGRGVRVGLGVLVMVIVGVFLAGIDYLSGTLIDLVLGI